MIQRCGVFLFVLLLMICVPLGKLSPATQAQVSNSKMEFEGWIPSQAGETYRRHMFLTGQHVVGRTC